MLTPCPFEKLLTHAHIFAYLHPFQNPGEIIRVTSTVHSLETGTLAFGCLPHVVADFVKITVHPALCDPCNYSLPHLRPKKSKNREKEIQKGFTKLGQVCHGQMYREADPKPRFLRFKVGFLILNSAQIRLSKTSGTVSAEWTVNLRPCHNVKIIKSSPTWSEGLLIGIPWHLAQYHGCYWNPTAGFCARVQHRV